MPRKITAFDIKMAGIIAEVMGVEIDVVLEDMFSSYLTSPTRSPDGKYTVIGIDNLNDTAWIHDKYNTREAALNEACRLTDENNRPGLDYKETIVYHAYDPFGKYIGGDTWSDDDF